jgi:hypothetical protein
MSFIEGVRENAQIRRSSPKVVLHHYIWSRLFLSALTVITGLHNEVIVKKVEQMRYGTEWSLLADGR